MSKENSEAAFPQATTDWNTETMRYNVEGLTKREYFAAKAMQGILAGRSVNYFGLEQDRVAEYAIKFADELLKQLSQ